MRKIDYLSIFRDGIKSGQVWYLPQRLLSMQYDSLLPDSLPFKVVKVYPTYVLFRHRTKKGDKVNQSVSLYNLYKEFESDED